MDSHVTPIWKALVRFRPLSYRKRRAGGLKRGRSKAAGLRNDPGKSRNSKHISKMVAFVAEPDVPSHLNLVSLGSGK